ncbi:MAG: bifunctional riboflavin kinase/FAD synthetase [Chitinophagaceae bacterium]|nr:bifunctional riboflavin kinase/FAD synthetase [Chitinophagaceae bacterium]
MQIYTNVDQLPVFKNAVLTIGTFDGVHLGHKKILEHLITAAKKVNGTAVLITFYPHPKKVVKTGKNTVYMLCTQQEKYALLERYGIKTIVVVPFDDKFAAQTPDEYIQHFLVDKFHPHTIIIGYDHRFGKERAGDYNLLEQKAGSYNFLVKEIPEKLIKDVIISSTKIRDALLDGDIETAAGYLGYPYFFSGKVIEGNKLGRTIGYPTANIKINEAGKLIPGNAVYAVDIALGSRNFKGMMNIGTRPTVGGTKRVIEVNIFDFDEEIYGKPITISLKKWLRSEKTFKGLDELKAQLAKDEALARKVN